MPTMVDVLERGITPLPNLSVEEIEALKGKSRAMLGVETQAKAELDRQIAHAVVARELPQAKLLDPTVLSWRWRTTLKAGRPFPTRPSPMAYRVPLPKLVMLTLDSPTFRIQRSPRSPDDRNTPIPEIAWIQLHDIVRVLDRAARDKRREYSLNFTWAGVIPDDARAMIERAKEQVKDNVYLLTEAPVENWSLKQVQHPKPIYLDPLIIGAINGHLYVLGSFDPTTLEEYVMQEWAV